MYAGVRALRFADGPDEVHLRDLARLEVKRQDLANGALGG